MKPERWKKIEAAFIAAEECAPGERDTYMAALGRDDPALKAEVEALLAQTTTGTDRLSAIVSSQARRLARNDQVDLSGHALDAYRIISEIGHGGMGVVYLAERADDQFEKQVAIKVVQGRLAHPRLVERFRAERQILASLEHPHIARLLDGGTTDDGSPYVVMEFIKGQPLDEYCDAANLSLRARLKLLISVCGAVQYAHRILVVHCDLKPTNILVMADGTPKLLDFGIAKLLQADGTSDVPDATGTVELRLTPEYASPEQIRGEPVTTASDVYSMGVILYRLLTGSRPYRLTGNEPGELLRAVCEQEPTLPSRTAPQRTRLGSRISADLDNIVLMALHKEPGHRYATASQLADDLQRYLDKLPVLARRSTWTYRVGRFVERNRVLVGLVAAVALSLVAGTVVSVNQTLRAERQAAIAGAVNQFLNEDLLAQADPYNEPDRELTLRVAVDRAAEQVETRFADKPPVHAAIRFTLGQIYQNLGDPAAAEPHYRASAALRQELDPGDVTTLKTWNALAGALYELGRSADAATILEKNIPKIRRSLGEDHQLLLSGLNILALVYDAEGRGEDAVEVLLDTIAAHRRVLGDEDPETLTAMNNLALVYSDQDRFAEADPLLVKVLDTRRRVLGDDHPDTILSLSSLGFHYTLMQQPEQAEPLLREAVQRGRIVLGPTHAWQSNNLYLLADLYRQMGHYADAEPLFVESIRLQQETQGESHYLTLRSTTGLAMVRSATGNHDSAVSLMRDVVRLRVSTEGPDHPRTSHSSISLAVVLLAADQPGEALDILDEVLQAARMTSPPPSRLLGQIQVNRGKALAALQREDEAIEVFTQAKEMLSEVLGPEAKDSLEAARLLAEH